jgi:hypothetical protein
MCSSSSPWCTTSQVHRLLIARFLACLLAAACMCMPCCTACCGSCSTNPLVHQSHAGIPACMHVCLLCAGWRCLPDCGCHCRCMPGWLAGWLDSFHLASCLPARCCSHAARFSQGPRLRRRRRTAAPAGMLTWPSW